ncbi:MAG: hypothetical protein DYG94_10070 [Leptolyngbya sp. PLA3]|nr:MAG: hypothetical protein EDM82_05215 [Cyanobacteria bacterium CYA]MCE7969076.1 hypothetical protein [Leptolyngbya sp. PL-A3]
MDLAAGMVTDVPQFLQRTVLPRADSGTAKTRRHDKFGHMIRTVSEAIAGYSCAVDRRNGGAS